MLLVEALAGTGKSTTGGWGMGTKIPKGVVLSREQKKIMTFMRQFTGTLGAQAFGKAITKDLVSKVPAKCEVATANAFGHRAWETHIGVRPEVDGYKNAKIFRNIFPKYYDRDEKSRVERSVTNLVRLCKCYLFDPTANDKINRVDIPGSEGGVLDVLVDGESAVEWLADRFDYEHDDIIIDYVKKVFDISVLPNAYIDYDDQKFMPIYHGITLPKFDHLLVDEIQDLNRAGQEMAFLLGKDITAFGDKHQSIFGFAGADTDSIANMWKRMQEIDSSARKLPMTVTRRCPKLVVKEANAYVPELRCPRTAPDGEVTRMSEEQMVDELLEGRDKMILCRINAPLVGLAFRLFNLNKRCYIQGRDIGSGIKDEIKRTRETDLRRALTLVNDRVDERVHELMTRAFPDENQAQFLRDRSECMSILGGNCDNVGEYFKAVDKMFKDTGRKEDTCLSSVHRAKGLEHEDVALLMPSILPYKKMMKGYQAQQELNLAYVALTRSKFRLARINEERDRSI